MKGMRNITLIAAMVLTLAAFGCSSTGTNDQVVDNAAGTVQNDSPTIASNADANLGAASVPTGGVDADSRTMADGATNTRIGNATNTNQVTPSVPSQGLTIPDNRSNTVATTQVAQSTTTYNTPVTAPSTSVSGTSGTSTTERVDTTASMSTTMPETSTTTTTTTVEERHLRQTTTDQSMASSAQTDDTTDDDTTTRRRMRKD